MDYGFLTLVAPLLTLAIAIATRKVPLAMLIGRLEIYPILLLFSRHTWKR